MEANGGLQYNYDVNIEDYKKIMDQMYSEFEKPEKRPTFVAYNEKPYQKTEKDIKIITHYLPQYHTFKENEEWWGKGFTEWTNTRVCTPRFSGHYQPRIPHGDIGYYDLNNIETLRNQVKLAKKHGIYGFCFYYYWFSGKRLMEKPVDMLLEHPEIDIPFCLCWANENWTRAWDGQYSQVLISQKYSEKDDFNFISDMKKYIDDSRYIKIDGKPLIIVYNPGHIPNCEKSFKKWRERARELGIDIELKFR
jgi:lipopolysaccharide biosynthesis protein